MQVTPVKTSAWNKFPPGTLRSLSQTHTTKFDRHLSSQSCLSMLPRTQATAPKKREWENNTSRSRVCLQMNLRAPFPASGKSLLPDQAMVSAKERPSASAGNAPGTFHQLLKANAKLSCALRKILCVFPFLTRQLSMHQNRATPSHRHCSRKASSYLLTMSSGEAGTRCPK